VGVHHRDDGQGERIEIGVFISGTFVLSETEALEKASIFIGVIQATIRPWLNDDLEAFGKIEFR
jgi:hypothetical protein